MLLSSVETMVLHRRNFLKSYTAAILAAAIPGGLGFATCHKDAFLEQLSRRSFQYFWDASDPETGICRDLIHGDSSDNVKKGDEARGSAGVTGFCARARPEIHGSRRRRDASLPAFTRGRNNSLA
jgi:hypothetical protein